jgi:hypothetical protein
MAAFQRQTERSAPELDLQLQVGPLSMPQKTGLIGTSANLCKASMKGEIEHGKCGATEFPERKGPISPLIRAMLITFSYTLGPEGRGLKGLFAWHPSLMQKEPFSKT